MLLIDGCVAVILGVGLQMLFTDVTFLSFELSSPYSIIVIIELNVMVCRMSVGCCC